MSPYVVAALSATVKTALTAALAAALAIVTLASSPQRQFTGAAQAAPRRTAPAPGRSERAVPFRVGETLRYDVSWSSFVTAGTATITVQEKKPSYSSTAYYIVAEGLPTPLVAALYPLYYKVDTLLDVYSLLPQRGSVYSEEGRRHRYKTTMFDRPGRKAIFNVEGASQAHAELAVPPLTQDVLSALFAVRTMPMAANERRTMPVTDDGTNYEATMAVGAAAERVKTARGDEQAWRVQLSVVDGAGKAVGRNMAIWIGADERRLPVKLQADLPVGTFNLLLRSAS